MYVYIYIYNYIDVCVCCIYIYMLYIYMCVVYIYIYICVCYMYIYIYIYIYLCSNTISWSAPSSEMFNVRACEEKPLIAWVLCSEGVWQTQHRPGCPAH